MEMILKLQGYNERIRGIADTIDQDDTRHEELLKISREISSDIDRLKFSQGDEA